MFQSLLLFILAGICEIGGGYLFWLWLRGKKSIWFAILGVFILALYGIVPTLQPVNFGRAYAAYGGIFIMLYHFSKVMTEMVMPGTSQFCRNI
ncbi:YnfA family protein [Microcystis aeruginosa]|jgi:small multidrug resistance family-3 protein|uniref:YnfA family protein n=2 Tax=Microcystis TaxID=1125 RepID=A0A552HFC6_MICVR|nr:YnfA family protein [Microcystis aeruginosa]MDJ0506527.1 YnfA family protein [Nostocales cyanobacterium LE14-WE12]TRU69924.1 MAG: YnfA family protein [Microcystis viridis Mv_BB_P_19951000_S68D]TRU85712.1 MAG: YnfA family protein [Microcystis viridis Mv_BB_P_19951000_S69D]MDB9420920.1 YnfA family protein [Microcystis aeruginosa CS-563/04]QGZ90393.1 hypothetical protein GQR42_13435 [Microcystis aeruginosa FD4]